MYTQWDDAKLTKVSSDTKTDLIATMVNEVLVYTGENGSLCPKPVLYFLDSHQPSIHH